MRKNIILASENFSSIQIFAYVMEETSDTYRCFCYRKGRLIYLLLANSKVVQPNRMIILIFMPINKKS